MYDYIVNKNLFFKKEGLCSSETLVQAGAAGFTFITWKNKQEGKIQERPGKFGGLAPYPPLPWPQPDLTLNTYHPLVWLLLLTS